MKFGMHIEGITGLLMNSVGMADPTNPYSKLKKEISSKRKKTEEDMARLARIEWEGLLYQQNGAVVLPGENIEAAIIDGAKVHKLGKATKGRILVFADDKQVDPSVSPVLNFGKANKNFVGDCIPNPKLDAIYAEFHDYRPVRQVGSVVMRCRPYFPKWSVDCVVEIRDEINVQDFITCVESAGRSGLCDYRPKYGQFLATLSGL